MKQLTKLEKETIILFNEDESDAQIYTFNGKLKRKLVERASEYPELYQLCDGKHYGSVTCTVPNFFLSVSFKKPISEDRHMQLRERALKTKPHLANK